MFEPLLDAVRAEASGTRALESVHAIARHHRVQASPGYDAAAAWLTDALVRSGVRPERIEVPGDGRTRFLGALMPRGWSCTRAVATLVDGAGRETLCDYDTEKLSLVLRSAPARGRFEIVALEDGTEDAHYLGTDVRGRVVLTAGPVHRVHELAVHERGAAGLLVDGRRLVPPVRTEAHDRDSIAYTSFWWGDGPERGWGFVVSPAVGARLRARLGVGSPLALEVEIASTEFDTAMPLVTALLPADVPAPEGAGEVLVLSHLCHPQPSANDNASGAAAALEVARTLAALRARGALPPFTRAVRVLWMPELTGTFAWLGADRARGDRVAAALNLDMVGEDQSACGSTLLVEHPPCFAGSFAEELVRRIRHAAQDWVTSYSGAGHYALTRHAEVPYSGGSDHMVLIDPACGVPCPMLIQWPDRYYHSSLDTPDKTDPDSLALAVRIAATYAAFLATAGPREQTWLAAAVGRGARRRLLAALDHAEPARQAEAERLRAAAALRSLGRLGGAAASAGATEGEDVEAFHAREIAPRLGGAAPPRSVGDARVPARTHGAPLDGHRHRLAGHGAIARPERDAWRAREAATPGGVTLLEVAWAACDGVRSIDALAHLAWLETGAFAPREIAAHFEWTVRLGLARWVEPDARPR